MKKMSILLIGIGTLLLIIFTLADSIGLGNDSGIGSSQLLGILIGLSIALVGIGLSTVRWDKVHNDKKLASFLKIPELQADHWILITLLITYVAFFLVPVYFSKIQIQYITKYIPNAFISHIGFDIETTVSYIEIWLTTNQSPYAGGVIAYPPLTLALFAPLLIIGYPAYFKLFAIVTLLAYISSALIIPMRLLPKRNQSLLLLFFIMGLFSYGIQFELERGQFNLIAFAICLFAIYIFHFNHKFRYFAYLLFTISIQLKVYPVFFIFMFISDWRDWPNIMKRFLGLGFLNFALLFVLGHKMFLGFLSAITANQWLLSSRYENISIKGFTHFLSNDVIGGYSASIFSFILFSEAFYWLIIGMCFISVIGYSIFHNHRGVNPFLLLICAIAALIIPSVSNDYKLSILITPIALVLSNITKFINPKWKLSSMILIIMTSLAYWTTLYPATVKPEILRRNFPLLIVILISVTILQFLAPYTYKREHR